MGKFYYHTAASAAQCCQLAARRSHRSSPGCVFFVIAGFDPAIYHSRQNLDRGKQWSNAVSVA